MTKTSHKKNRPFDFKLIDLVEPHPVLYQRQSGLSTFEAMKAKNEIWCTIASQLGQPVQFCMMRWNNLRGQFQKELRRCRELCPKLGVIRGSSWPYLERLRFLEHTVQYNRSDKNGNGSKRGVKRKYSDDDSLEGIEDDQEFGGDDDGDDEDNDNGEENDVEEHLQSITKVEDETTEVGWEECEEFFATEDEPDDSTQVTVFKNESSESIQENQQQQQQQNVVIDGSEFSIITEIIVNSDNISEDISLAQTDQQIDNLSLINEQQRTTLSHSPTLSQDRSLSQSPTLTQSSSLSRSPQSQDINSTPTPPASNHEGQETPSVQLQQSSGISTNFQRMRNLLDGFDEANRSRIEQRILAYLCRVQLCTLYKQDIDSLNI